MEKGEEVLKIQLEAVKLNVQETLRFANTSDERKAAIISPDYPLWAKIRMVQFEHGAVTILLGKSADKIVRQQVVLDSYGEADMFLIQLLEACEVAKGPMELMLVDDLLNCYVPAFKEVLAASTRIERITVLGRHGLMLDGIVFANSRLPHRHDLPRSYIPCPGWIKLLSSARLPSLTGLMLLWPQNVSLDWFRPLLRQLTQLCLVAELDSSLYHAGLWFLREIKDAKLPLCGSWSEYIIFIETVEAKKKTLSTNEKEEENPFLFVFKNL